MRARIRERLLSVARVVLARPGMQWLARLLFDASLRGLGILNYADGGQSGERAVIERLVAAVRSGALGAHPPVVVDVGANEGDYAAAWRERCPEAELHLFEPHPRTAARLERRFAGAAVVTASAVGATTGTVELFDYEDGRGSSHASVIADVFAEVHGRPARATTVPVTTLDDHLRHVAGTVLLLKIDTEGYELEVLRGASSTIAAGKLHCIQFEFNEMNVVTRVFLRDFADILPGFALYRLLPNGLTPLRLRPVDEIFAYQNVLAVRAGSPVAAHLGV